VHRRVLANLSFLSPAIPGPEEYLAGRPMLLVTVIFTQIVVTLVLVGVLARREATVSRATRTLGAGSHPEWLHEGRSEHRRMRDVGFSACWQ
jgi:hypothetical protein